MSKDLVCLDMRRGMGSGSHTAGPGGARERDCRHESKGEDSPKMVHSVNFGGPVAAPPQEHTTISLAPTAEGLSTPGDGDGGEVKREGNRRRSHSLRNQQQEQAHLRRRRSYSTEGPLARVAN
jgi:hypothetical protein